MQQLPSKVKGYRSKVINNLIDYVESVTPLNSADIAINKSPRGFTPHSVALDSLADPYHFQVERIGTTKVRVRSGTWSRWDNLQTYIVDMTVDSGTSKSYDDFKTITGITVTQYIKLTLTLGGSPTVVAAGTGNDNYPYADTGLIWPIARVTCAGGVITGIEPVWYGGNIFQGIFYPDDISLDFSDTGRPELKNFHDAATKGVPVATDLFPHKAIAGTLLYTSWDNMVTQMGSDIQAILDGIYAVIGHVHAGYVPEAPTDGTIYGRKNAAWVGVAGDSHTHAHTDLTWGADDHNGTEDTTNRYVQCIGGPSGGTSTRNSFDAGTFLGDHDHYASISPDARKLYGTSGDGAEVLAWADTLLNIAAAAKVVINNTGVYDGAGSECLQLKGGMSGVGRSKFIDGTTYVDILNSGGDGLLMVYKDGTNKVTMCGLTYALSTNGYINSSTGYYINDVGPFVLKALADCSSTAKVLAYDP